VTRDDFIGNLEAELRRNGRTFDPAHLRDFVEDMWLLVPDQPDLAVWANIFLEALRRKRSSR
jgi:hypothetical protein